MALAKMNSSARVVLPEPGAPMMILIEFAGIPPPRSSSSSRLPVLSRPGARSISSNMLGVPHSRGSRFEKPAHGVDQRVLGEGFLEESVRSRFPRPFGRGQDAENENGDILGLGIGLEAATEGQPIQDGNEDLGDDDIRTDPSGLLERSVTVFRESDRVARLIQEVRLELANVGIAIDHQ